MGRESAREQRAGSRLRSLPESHWRQFQDARCPNRPDSTIDQVVVGPSGIYVIGYETTLGQVVVDGQEIRQNGYPLAAEVAGLAETGYAVASLLPVRYRPKVTPVLCFTQDQPLGELVHEVMVASSMTLEHILRSAPPVLSTSEVAEVTEVLDRRLEPAPEGPAPTPEAEPPRRGRRTVAACLLAAAALVAVFYGPELAEATSQLIGTPATPG